jgi:hypothetical protein
LVSFPGKPYAAIKLLVAYNPTPFKRNHIIPTCGPKMNFEIADVKEKEIDFLIAEEFASSSSFITLFLDNFEEYNSQNFKVVQINRSHTDSYGESDIEVFLKNKEGFCLAILIENKVSAQFQDNQLLRYQKRGNSYLEQGICDDFKTILVAPKDYSHKEITEIDIRIDYEDLVNWFDENIKNDIRYKFKKALLIRALERATLGYQRIEDEQVTRFWNDYWQHANQVAPILNMPEPGKRPSGSTFIYFAPADFPSGLSLVHKVSKGAIDLQIAGLAKHIGSFRTEYVSNFNNEYKIIKAGNSISVRSSVPVIDLQKSVSEQEKNVRLSLETALELYEWFAENRDSFQKLVGKWI